MTDPSQGSRDKKKLIGEFKTNKLCIFCFCFGLTLNLSFHHFNFNFFFSLKNFLISPNQYHTLFVLDCAAAEHQKKFVISSWICVKIKQIEASIGWMCSHRRCLIIVGIWSMWWPAWNKHLFSIFATFDHQLLCG